MNIDEYDQLVDRVRESRVAEHWRRAAATAHARSTGDIRRHAEWCDTINGRVVRIAGTNQWTDAPLKPCSCGALEPEGIPRHTIGHLERTLANERARTTHLRRALASIADAPNVGEAKAIATEARQQP